MYFQTICSELSAGAQILHFLLDGIPQDEAQFRPSPEGWSILEVACHLYDEEREDFRPRLNFILNGAQGSMPPINPAGWVLTRGYNKRNLQETLFGFLEERKKSLAWLEELKNPDWNLGFQAPFGLIHAGDIFSSWAAHDKLHARQIIELRYLRILNLAQPYDVRYAGDW